MQLVIMHSPIACYVLVTFQITSYVHCYLAVTVIIQFIRSIASWPFMYQQTEHRDIETRSVHVVLRSQTAIFLLHWGGENSV